jgi:hypothetical protein
LPAVDPVTVTLKVHGTPGATEAPLNEIVRVAAVVVKVPLHRLVLESPMLNPAGNMSLNPTPFSVVVGFEFVIVKLSVVVLPNAIADGLNDLAIVGDVSIVKLTVAGVVLSFGSAKPLVVPLSRTWYWKLPGPV